MHKQHETWAITQFEEFPHWLHHRHKKISEIFYSNFRSFVIFYLKKLKRKSPSIPSFVIFSKQTKLKTFLFKRFPTKFTLSLHKNAKNPYIIFHKSKFILYIQMWTIFSVVFHIFLLQNFYVYKNVMNRKVNLTKKKVFPS